MTKAGNKVSSVRDWLQRYAKFSERLFKSGRVLDDQQLSPLFSGQQNVDLQSTTQLSAEQQSIEVFEKTGFICRSVLWKEERHSKNLGVSKEGSMSIHGHSIQHGTIVNSAPVIEKYNFLSDWERLWNYFAEENSDEIAVQLPFLRATMELIFHHKVVQLMYFLTLWNTTLFSILAYKYPQAGHGDLAGGYFIDVIFELAVYLLLCVMNKGPASIKLFRLSARRTAPVKNVNSDLTVPSSETHQINNEQDYKFFATLRRAWMRGKQEFAGLIHGRSIQNSITSSNERSKNNVGDEPFQKKRKTDKHRSLYYYRWINMALKVLTRDYGVDIKQIHFNRRWYRLSVLFSVVLFPIYAVLNLYVHIATLLTGACSQRGHGENSYACDSFTDQFLGSGFGFTLLVTQILFGSSVLVSLAGLAYGGEIAFRLAECWTQKFHSLRRIVINMKVTTKSAHGDSRVSNNRLVEGKLLTLPRDGQEISDIIARDASEHYLFICKLLRIAGELWSPVMLLFIFLSLYMCLVDFLYLVAEFDGPNGSPAGTLLIIRITIFVAIRIFALLVYPIFSIAFANSHFNQMYEMFRIADVSDYQMIGGRNRWLDTFTISPPTWMFFGVSITPERLFALLWAAFIASAGVFLTSFISRGKL